ncbi:hypothetical protein BLNAU_6791 [Blattamonas nauphoetae]|uniref:Protein kinase domain-containing protein n=1 Tax=Blattamonas nauphoetae TaxID=2049346 RepID=A0ABQ9Y3K7_9EUKA|nr:hypothetical protein BLNAU_6791 [Blattamonas nauphoetae]
MMWVILLLHFGVQTHPDTQVPIDFHRFVTNVTTLSQSTSQKATAPVTCLPQTYNSKNVTILATSLSLIGISNRTIISSPTIASSSDSVIIIQNSSLLCSMLSLKAINGHIVTIDISSSFSSSRCHIYQHQDQPALVISGSCYLVDTTIESIPTVRNTPLTTSPDGHGILFINGISQSDSAVSKSIQLLGDNYSSLTLSNCIFRNISQFHNESTPRKIVENRQSTLISGADLVNLRNGLYGTIFRSINDAGDFYGTNMTITANEAEEDAYPNKYTTHEEKIDTATFTFSHFENCSSEAFGGGLHMQGNGKFTVTDCLFVNCRSEKNDAGHGGGLSVDSMTTTTESSAEIKRCIFRRCFAAHVGGGLHVGRYDPKFDKLRAEIADIETTDCWATSQTGGMLFQFLLETTVANCSINDCQANTATAIFIQGTWEAHTYSYFKIDAPNQEATSLIQTRFAYNQIRFDSWTVFCRGPITVGVFFISKLSNSESSLRPYGESILVYPLPIFSDIIIERGESSPGAPTITFDEDWDQHFTTGFDPANVFLTQTPTLTTGSQPTAGTGGIPQRSWIAANTILMNNQTGKEAAFCWVPKSSCQSFRDLVPRTGLQFEGAVLVEIGEFSEKDINIGARTLSITGESKDGSILTDSGSTTALLIVSTGSLSLSNLTLVAYADSPLISSEGRISLTEIVLSSPASPRQSSLLVATAGSVTASSFSVSSVSFASGHIFDLTDSDLELSNMQFSSISGSTDGSVFSSSTSGKISLTSVEFSGCSCGNGKKGRSIFIDRAAFTADAIFLKEVTFTKPTTQGELEVFISCPSAGNHVTSDWSLFVLPVPSSEDQHKQFWLEDTENPSLSGPMVFHFYPHTEGTVHVSGKSSDHVLCGVESAPCLTLERGMNVMKDTNEVVVDTDIELSTKLTSTAAVWSLKRESSKVLTISKFGSFVTSVSGAELTLSSLLIHFKETIESSFLAASLGKITLSSCTVGDGSTSIPMTIGTVSGGSLILTGANTLKLVSSAKPLFVVTGGVLEVQTGISLTHSTDRTSSLFQLSGGSTSIAGTEAVPIVMSSITFTSEDSLIKMSGVASLTVAHCQCSSISSAGSGSVIHSTSSGTIELYRVMFSGNKCGNEMNGRSIFIERTFSSSCLIMTTVTFPTRTKQGHHEVFLKGRGIDLVVTDDWITFIGEENTQTVATMEEFWGEDTTESGLTGPLAYHLFKHSSGRKTVDVSFWDHSSCGKTQLPCKTLAATFSSLKESKQELFVASDLDLTSKLDAHAKGSLILSSSTSPNTVSLSAAAQFSVLVSTSIHLKDLKFLISSSISNTLFDVSGGSAQLTSVKISTKASTSNDQLLFVSPLFSISNGGEASIQSSAISDISLSTDSLIVHSSGSLSIVSTTFSSIVRQNGNGSVLDSSMDENMKLVLNDVTLQNVQSLNGAADGMFISFDTNPLLNDVSVFKLENIKYSPSLSSNGAEPNFIWLEGPSLDSSIVVSDPRFKDSYDDSTKDEWLWSVNTVTKFSASLLFYLRPQRGPVGVADGGVDMLRCGYSSVWCESLSYALTRAATQETETIHIHQELTLNKKVDLANDLNLIGKPTGAKVILGADGSFAEETGDTVHFSELEIVLGTSTRTEPAFIITLGHMNLSSIEITVKTEQTLPIFKCSDSTLTLQTITFSPTSHQLHRIVDCSGGKLTINTLTLKDLSFSSTPIFLSSLKSASMTDVRVTSIKSQVFLEAKHTQDLFVQSSHFIGHQESQNSNDDQQTDEENTLCLSTGGFVQLVNTTASIHSSEFSHFSQGALSTSNSTTTIISSTFENNVGGNSSFPSLRRNIHCSEGKIIISSVNGGDGSHDQPSAWITQSEDCQFESSLITSEAVYFIPTLDTETSKTSFNKKAGLFSIVVGGSLLIPCGLKMEAFSVVDSQAKSTKLIDLSTSPTTSWNETDLSLSLTKSLLTSLGEDLEWRLRLVFGKDHRTNQSILLKLSTSDERKAQFAAIRNWLIPLIIGVSVLLLILIIVIVILYRRRQKQKEKKNEMKPMLSEMEEDLDSPKMPIADTFALNDVHTTANLVKANQNEFDQVHELNETANHLNDRRAAAAMLKPIEIINCDAPNKVATIIPHDTLYRRLHGSGTRMTASEKERVAQEVARLLRTIADQSPHHLILSQFTPHWVLFGQDNEIKMRTTEGETEVGGTKEGTSRAASIETGKTGLRWMAPEVFHQNPNNSQGHGAVFSLGLVLWEIETGIVPFGETDAANAQRQLESGIQPPMDKIKNEHLVSLITQCLSLDAKKRPTLAEVEDALKQESMFSSSRQEIVADV